MRKISFIEKNVALRNGNTAPLDTVLLVKISDVSSKIIAKVKVAFTLKVFILWEGVVYKPLNEWTEEEIDNRIIELL